jgi:hypothetical protein
VFSTAPIGTADAPPTKRVTVVLSVTSGAIMALSAGDVTVGGTGKARSFAGTIAALNEFFTDPAGRVRYRPAANDAGSRDLTVTVTEVTLRGIVQSAATSTIDVMAVNDAPAVNVPEVVRVVEDVRGAISWSTLGLPFADVDSSTLTVTLTVADGVIDAESDAGVTVGGSSTARTFTGSTASLNAYFRSLGRVGYTTARDQTALRVLTTTVSDGERATTASSEIRITPVNDRPTIAATTSLMNGVRGRPLVITHAMLMAASGARDAENAPLKFTIQSLQAGRLEKWDGHRWLPVSMGGAPVPIGQAGQIARPIINPGERIRWIPPAGVVGTVAAFTIRVSDGELASANVSRVSVAVA